MICPKCGEPNADNYRFCGMCGAVLEVGKPSTSTTRADPPRAADVPVSLRIAANPARAAAAAPRPASSTPSSSATSSSAPLISGPSLLGLGSQPQSGPSIDSLREKAFSGTPTFVYQDAKTGRGRTFALAVILAILAVGVWFRYHYIGYGVPTAKPSASAATQNSPAALSVPAPSAPNAGATTLPPAATLPPVTPSAPPASHAATDDETPQPSAKPVQKPAQTPAQTRAPANPPKPAVRETASATRPAIPAKAAPADDSGSAAFRKGEAYLYGRGGMTENCAEAVKNLKSASVSGNAKARSTFGTMYATGHCVPRDLPTAYSWFAAALQVDPNNQILEKDLTALWNQMTPPERQLATKLKQ